MEPLSARMSGICLRLIINSYFCRLVTYNIFVIFILYLYILIDYFVAVSALGDIRNEHDANLTYEGENHVLIQQTANYLLKFWPAVLGRKPVSSPLQSVDFLTNGLTILSNKFNARTIEEMCQPNSK